MDETAITGALAAGQVLQVKTTEGDVWSGLRLRVDRVGNIRADGEGLDEDPMGADVWVTPLADRPDGHGRTACYLDRGDLVEVTP